MPTSTGVNWSIPFYLAGTHFLPSYGYYGGPSFSNGYGPNLVEGTPGGTPLYSGAVQPLDALDAIYYKHDIAYAEAEFLPTSQQTAALLAADLQLIADTSTLIISPSWSTLSVSSQLYATAAESLFVLKATEEALIVDINPVISALNDALSNATALFDEGVTEGLISAAPVLSGIPTAQDGVPYDYQVYIKEVVDVDGSEITQSETTDSSTGDVLTNTIISTGQVAISEDLGSSSALLQFGPGGVTLPLSTVGDGVSSGLRLSPNGYVSFVIGGSEIATATGSVGSPLSVSIGSDTNSNTGVITRTVTFTNSTTPPQVVTQTINPNGDILANWLVPTSSGGPWSASLSIVGNQSVQSFSSGSTQLSYSGRATGNSVFKSGSINGQSYQGGSFGDFVKKALSTLTPAKPPLLPSNPQNEFPGLPSSPSSVLRQPLTQSEISHDYSQAKTDFNAYKTNDTYLRDVGFNNIYNGGNVPDNGIPYVPPKKDDGDGWHIGAPRSGGTGGSSGGGSGGDGGAGNGGDAVGTNRTSAKATRFQSALQGNNLRELTIDGTSATALSFLARIIEGPASGALSNGQEALTRTTSAESKIFTWEYLLTQGDYKYLAQFSWADNQGNITVDRDTLPIEMVVSLGGKGSIQFPQIFTQATGKNFSITTNNPGAKCAEHSDRH